MLCVCGLEEIHREKMLIMMLPKSVSRCAASVMMARLPAAYPPAETRDGDCRLSTEGRVCESSEGRVYVLSTVTFS